ncbi:hypothetical protein M514_23835 [Trichuris suis]|uniref:Uncharacterized protein n=1 Tax=Trichuris suis TaxID=68888 RepID=A0A085N3E1_9BILA|nr:hypothetical protein M514_23835 [Trichuris suis]
MIRVKGQSFGPSFVLSRFCIFCERRKRWGKVLAHRLSFPVSAFSVSAESAVMYKWSGHSTVIQKFMIYIKNYNLRMAINNVVVAS